MSHFIERATTSALIAIAAGTAALGIALGSATVAGAKPFTQDPDSLKMMCDRYGGSYIGKTKGSGAWCAWKDGSVTVCDKNDSCTIVEPAKAVRQDPGWTVQQPGGVLVPVG
ncbi:MAG: hypothetical protein HZB45_08400 [Mycolicibacterium rufum]|nr:hypothetical protein [Mycolicibacterium rufum]